MLSSKYIFTILVTIALTVVQKPCKSINSINHIKEIKQSFLQKYAAGEDSPSTVTSGERVEVASNKDVAGTESSVESHQESKTVKEHDQDKPVSEADSKEGETSVESDKGKEPSESEGQKKSTGAQDSKTVENSDDHTKTSSKESEKKTTDSQDSKDQADETEKNVESGSKPSDQDDQDKTQEENQEEHSEPHTDNQGDETKKEEQSESRAPEKTPESSSVSHNQDEVESKEKEEDVHTHDQTEQKPEEKAEVTSDQGEEHKETGEEKQETSEVAHESESHNDKVSSGSKGAGYNSTGGSECKEAAPCEHAVASVDKTSTQEQHKTTESVQEQTHTVPEVNAQPTQATEEAHVAKQPSTTTQSVVTSHVATVTEAHQGPAETGAAPVQNQSVSQVPTTPAAAPTPVDLDSLTDDEKKTVVNFWSKPSGDCSVDCSHSCKSELQGSTQCVNATTTSLSCSTFSDTASLTCPAGYTPCTQPTVAALKSYTLKNGDREVGALEVDGSNFNKCMGLVLTTPNGVCDKEHFVSNILYTSKVLNLDYEINVAADKLTFGNLKMKNGDYKVCVFQRHEGSLEGMNLANLWTKLLEFINPTSSTPSQTKTVFVMEVGTLKVSD